MSNNNEIMIKCFKRSQTGKSYSKKLKNNNLIPSIIYGFENLAIAIDCVFINKLIFKIFNINSFVKLLIYNSLDKYSLNVDEFILKNVIVKNIQFNNLYNKVIHIDFLEVDIKKKAKFNIPLKININVKNIFLHKGLKQLKNTILVECLVFDIPSFIEFNLYDLKKKKIYVSDLDSIENIKYVDKNNSVIAILS